MNESQRENHKAVNDEMLNTPGQLTIRMAVRSLPEESPSMSWRSQLNDKIAQKVQVKAKRRKIFYILSPSLGLAFAGALLAVAFLRPVHPVVNVPATQPPVASSSTLESSLVAEHNRSDVEQDVIGTGLAPAEAQTSSQSDDSDPDPDAGSNAL